MAKKSKTRPGRGADQFIVRMPPGMRDGFAKRAAEHGRSMNAELVHSLENYLELSDPKTEFLSEVGLLSMSKRFEASAHYLDQLLFDIRDIDLDAFISDQRSQGLALTRTEAIRKILREYLGEHGYLRSKE